MLSRRDSHDHLSRNRDRGRTKRRDRGLGRPRSSRSRSPRDKSPNNSFRKNHTEQDTHILSACPVCLSRKKHPIRQCQSPTLWNGKKTKVTRAEDGGITDSKGRRLCLNWNLTPGCKDKLGGHIHECSGCGDPTHGAQNCSYAEKSNSSYSPRR